MKGQKILYGVCGIGSGHTYRQLPIIERLAAANTLVIFAYDFSFRFLSEHFRANPDVHVIPVAVPFYAGGEQGLDFVRTAHLAAKKPVNFTAINCQAMAEAAALIGKPDLVISDYEPVSAQYAYAYATPLVTIDQQSKYLTGDLPERINGQSYLDEIMRLKMFFPRAEARLACSFFNVATRKSPADRVIIIPPVIRSELLALVRRDIDSRSFIVYLTAQQGFRQDLPELMQVCAGQKAARFHIFLPSGSTDKQISLAPNITLHRSGGGDFLKVLQSCSGIISTAGHGLLSEAMFLGIPVYAMPLPLYEQEMNAKVIDDKGFGISWPILTHEKLTEFIRCCPHYSQAIIQDDSVLLRGDGAAEIMSCLADNFGLQEPLKEGA